jgi:hypothetical protein
MKSMMNPQQQQHTTHTHPTTHHRRRRRPSEYVRIIKLNMGEIIDDADRQIEAMDDTRTKF